MRDRIDLSDLNEGDLFFSGAHGYGVVTAHIGYDIVVKFANGCKADFINTGKQKETDIHPTGFHSIEEFKRYWELDEELRDAHDYLDMLGIEKTQVYEQGHEHLLSLEHRITLLANSGSPKPVDQRFEVAKAAMQGLLANPESFTWKTEVLSRDAVMYADALLTKLNEAK